jgi:hypothetical protein
LAAGGATDEVGGDDWPVALSGRASPGSDPPPLADNPPASGVEDAGGGGGTGARGTAAAAPATVAGAGEPGGGEPAGADADAGREGVPEDDADAGAEVAPETEADVRADGAPVGSGSGTFPGVVPGEDAPDGGAATTGGVGVPETAPATV